MHKWVLYLIVRWLLIFANLMAWLKKNESTKDGDMPFFGHIEVLRWHIIRSILAILVFFFVALFNKNWVFDVLIFGPTQNDFITYKALCFLSNFLYLKDMFCLEGVKINFINTELAGQFMMHIQISFLCGFILGFPYTIYELWKFIKPGLYEKETRYTEGIVIFISLLFLIGVAFGYFILIPFSLNFFASYSISENVNNMFTATNYISFLSMFLLSSGLMFELPMVVFFLAKIGILTPQFMRTYRRHAVVVLCVASAIITPTADVGTMMLVFVPLYFLYEISIFIAAAIYQQRQKELR